MEEVIKKVEQIKDVDSQLQNFLSGRLAILNSNISIFRNEIM